MARTPSKAVANAAAKEQSNSMLAVVARAAADPKTDVAKMQALLEMQERLQHNQAIQSFNQAMARLQKVLPRISKNGMIEFTDKRGNDRSTPFAKYEDIDRAIRPLYIKEGFSISFNSKYSADGVVITGIIRHELGHFESCEMRLPLDTSGSKNSLQAMGSTLSYGKRYTVCMLLNIITTDEDDDAHSAMPKSTGFGDLVKEDGETIEGNFSTIDGPPKQSTMRRADPDEVGLDDYSKPRVGISVFIGGVESKPFEYPQGAADYLYGVMRKRNTKKSRLELLMENTKLLKALDTAGDEERVKRFHTLCDEGK